MGLGFWARGLILNGPNRRALQLDVGFKKLQGGQRAAGRLNPGSWVVSEEAAHSSGLLQFGSGESRGLETP